MPAVYPRGPAPVPEAPPFDKPLCVSSLIAIREARPNITRQLAGGKVIHIVGGRVEEDVYPVWDEIEAERKQMQAVPLQDESKYIEAVSAIAVNIDPALWLAGMQDKLGVDEIAAPKEL